MNRASWTRFLFLLRREFLFQLDGRRAHARGVYPGISWFALLCLGVVLLEFNTSRLDPESSKTAIDNFTLLASGQAVLIALRSAVYCALSFARDLQNHTAAVVRVTPVSRTSSLLAKLCACLAPLWCELVLFLPISVLFFSVYLWLPPAVVLSVFPYLFMVSLVSGCFGLMLGSAVGRAAQAGRTARMMMLYLLFFFPLLNEMFSTIWVPTGVLAFWLAVASRRAPHRLLTLGSVGAVFGALTAGTASGLYPVEHLHPICMIAEYYPGAIRVSMGGFSSHPLVEPVTTLAVYGGLALLFFLVARRRYQYAR